MRCKKCNKRIREKCDYCLKPLDKRVICYHAPLIFSKPDGDHGVHFCNRKCLREFCLDLAGYYESNAEWASTSNVVIIDNNPVSIASYMEEYPGVLD